VCLPTVGCGDRIHLEDARCCHTGGDEFKNTVGEVCQVVAGGCCRLNLPRNTLGCWGVGVSGCWNVGVFRCWGVEVLGCSAELTNTTASHRVKRGDER
jgi:hypothetical protein